MIVKASRIFICFSHNLIRQSVVPFLTRCLNSGKSNRRQKLSAVLILFSLTLFFTPNCNPLCLYLVPQFTRYGTYYWYANAVLFCKDKPVLCSITRHMVPVIYPIDNWKCTNTSLPFSMKTSHYVVAIFVSDGTPRIAYLASFVLHLPI